MVCSCSVAQSYACTYLSCEGVGSSNPDKHSLSVNQQCHVPICFVVHSCSSACILTSNPCHNTYCYYMYSVPSYWACKFHAYGALTLTNKYRPLVSHLRMSVLSVSHSQRPPLLRLYPGWQDVTFRLTYADSPCANRFNAAIYSKADSVKEFGLFMQFTSVVLVQKCCITSSFSSHNGLEISFLRDWN